MGSMKLIQWPYHCISILSTDSVSDLNTRSKISKPDVFIFEIGTFTRTFVPHELSTISRLVLGIYPRWGDYFAPASPIARRVADAGPKNFLRYEKFFRVLFRIKAQQRSVRP